MLNLNIVKCGTDVKGTAVGNCLLQLNMIIFFILAKKGWSIDVLNDTLDDELIKKRFKKEILLFYLLTTILRMEVKKMFLKH
ncbi:hypothetical protein AS589_09440 [Empedobacter brevis]|uniref:hypothetical protein n=1 Tax=Empedobacter brevis TaxID=247 RepID=UPI00131FA712|nr:hypothetical protein [Empedobacter brevis]QHC84978.1 hypothetical protein AS589_09440 [Empedobacter brevis]